MNTQKNNAEIYYALCGLLHDIGKFYQRTFEKTDFFNKDKYVYAHAYYTEKFIDDYLKNYLDDDLIYILKISAAHHKKNPEYEEKIIQKADHLSASEREKEREDEEKKSFQEKRLHSVFSRFSENNEEYFYNLLPLSLDIKEKNSFPKLFREVKGDYITLWNNFSKELVEYLKFFNSNKDKQDLNKFFNKIYSLLQKYTWCIPSDTYSKEKGKKQYSDISLFDHSKITAAFAVSIYKQIKKEIDLNNLEFSLIKCDISGIQKFLFNVYSGEGGIAKRLRGRSLFLTLLPEIISYKLIKALNYTIANILFCGGGVFEILIANKDTSNAEEFLDSINKFLIKEFEGELGLIYEIIDFTEDEVYEFSKIENKLNKNLAIKKLKKFQNFISYDKFIDVLNNNFNKLQNKSKCKACKIYFTYSSKDFCNWCDTFFKLGEALPKTKYITFSTQKITSNNILTEFSFMDLSIYFMYNINQDEWNLAKDIILIPRYEEIPMDNFYTRFKLFGNSLPKEKNKTLTFEDIADSSDGDKKLGILKMDVDSLSTVFNNKEISSFSRKATLSRMLDFFFSGIINEICKDENGKNKYHYILYSGGDDLFLISPWDKSIEIANKINNYFSEFTKSENFTLSAGLTICHSKYPVDNFAYLVEKAEKFAKDNGKNRITIYNSLLEWSELKDSLDNSNKVLNYYNEKKISKSICYSTLTLLKNYCFYKEDIFLEIKKTPHPLYYPLLFYLIKRNFKGQGEDIENFLRTISFDNFRKSYFIFNYTLTKLREVK